MRDGILMCRSIGNSLGKRDEFIAAEVDRFVREFQAIGVSVGLKGAEERVLVFVHAPYMLHSVSLIDNAARFAQLKERHRVRLKGVKEGRETAPEAVKCFLKHHFYDQDGREKFIASGRGDLKGIKALLQAAVDERVVLLSEGKKHPDSYDLRAWLKRYGVGIDCSGFVEQALRRLVEVGCEEGAESPHGSERDVGFLRCERVYRMIVDSPGRGEGAFIEVPTPARARPGDVIVSRSHMRIVVRGDGVRDGALVLRVAESTSAHDIPSGQVSEEGDVGPRIIELKYPKPNEPIAEQNPQKKRLIDDEFEGDGAENGYVIGRYRMIEQLWSDANRTRSLRQTSQAA